MPSEISDTDDTADPRATAEPGTPENPPGPGPGDGDVVQAVAEFLDDLIDDPAFAHDPSDPGASDPDG